MPVRVGLRALGRIIPTPRGQHSITSWAGIAFDVATDLLYIKKAGKP